MSDAGDDVAPFERWLDGLAMYLHGYYSGRKEDRRKRLSNAVAATATLLEDIGEKDLSRPLTDLVLALQSLEIGKVHALLEPAKYSGGGEPELPEFWMIRAAAAVALDCMIVGGRPVEASARAIATKHEKSLNGARSPKSKGPLWVAIKNWRKSFSAALTTDPYGITVWEKVYAYRKQIRSAPFEQRAMLSERIANGIIEECKAR